MNRVHWILILWVILALSTLLQMITYRYFEDYEYSLLDYFVNPSASLMTGILLFFMYLRPLFDLSANLGLVNRILILTVVGIIYSFLFILIMHLFPQIFYENSSNYWDSIKGFFVSNFHNVLKNFLFQIALLFAFEYLSKETKLMRQQKNLEVQLNQTKLELLKSQLHPHFLFNSLNSVVSEIDENKKNAQEMIIHLSDILRETLDSDFSQSIRLEEELALIGKYLAIEKIRYEDQLTYSFQMDKEALNWKIPKLILLPLVENAIKHGFKGSIPKLHIEISSKSDSPILLIQNNGAKLNSDYQMGAGLQNVVQRMEIYTDKKDSFKIYQENEWIINQIELK
jgi:two-component system LytT family sensor kinase